MSQEGRGTEGANAEAKKYVVFCADGWDYGDPGYIIFTHEADVMMIAAAGEVESGKLTPAEARKILEPYREMLPSLYTDEHRPVFDPGRRSWNDPDSFPQADYVQQSLQASQIFWHEVDKLRIEGLFLELGGISPDFPLEDEIFSVEDKEALKKLKEKVSDKYEIVVKKAIDEFDAMGKSVEWAKKLIEEATITKAPQQSRPVSDATRPGGADLVRQALNDPAFDAGRYIDDEIKNLRDGDLVRICIVGDESQADLINAIGVVISTSGGSCTLDVDGETHVFERRDIELMPTGFNPHYGDKQ